MTNEIRRRLGAPVLAPTLCVLIAAAPLRAGEPPQVQMAEATRRAQVRELHRRGSDVDVTLVDGATRRGRIIRVEDDSFTIRDGETGQETAWRYAQVVEVRRRGLSPGRKAALTAAIVGGGVLLVLCAFPFPVGFLCRADPS